MRSWFVVPALALLLTGCSGGGESEKEAGAELASDEASSVERAWRADLSEELGMDQYDFDSAVAQAGLDCERTAVDDWTLNLALGGDLEGVGVTRIGLEHVCPELLDTFDEAVEEVRGVDDLTTYVCSRPAASLSTEDKMKLKLACAS